MIKCCLIVLPFLFFIAACNADNIAENTTTNNIPENAAISKSVNADKTTIANPAASRCVNDGYQLEPVIENGVTIDYICINPENNLKCEVWKYFRNECSLKD